MDLSDILVPNENLVNYYFFEKRFNDDEIKKIIELSNIYKKDIGNIGGKIDKTYRNSNITWLPFDTNTKYLYENVKDLMITANKRMWNFHITTVKDNIQLSEYVASNTGDAHGKYDWHMDFGQNVSTRKLSMTIQLTDPNDYEGGDLEFMIHRDIIKAPRSKGTVIIFPSYLQHRVTEVTSGIRHSLVTWFHGPPFI
jgi:PKHD-type hydroxylase